MTVKSLTARTLKQHGAALAAGEYSAEELTRAYLLEIEKKDGELGAYLTVLPEKALETARRIDRRRAAGEPLTPLAGIPFALKDNLCTRGVRTTCGSKILENYIPPYTATAVRRLEDAGAVLLGKCNMDEFGMGSTTEHSAFCPTRNPLSPDRVPGGSSGGCAAAVAAGEAAFALGSDTGGSVRQPAAFCGIVGLKPTWGAVSRYGLTAFASSLDQIGPMTRTVEDNAAVFDAIAGPDEKDATALPGNAVAAAAEIGKEVRGLRVGMIRELFSARISPEVRDAAINAAKAYERMGASVDEVSLPSLSYALAAYYIISSAEASSNLARFDGVRYGRRAEQYDNITELYTKSRSEGFGAEVRRRIMLGTFVLSSGYYDAYYKKALSARALICAESDRALQSFDALLAPAAPTAAVPFGYAASPVEMYQGDLCTVPANIAGLPALSLPCGETAEGLPVGMQLIGKARSEPLLYRMGAAFECERGRAE